MPTKKTEKKGAPDTAPADSIAKNRRLAVVSASVIPKVPAGFVATPNEERSRRLTRPADSLRAEIREALDELIANKASYRGDAGDQAPDLDQAEALRPRLSALHESVRAADALAGYLHEAEEIGYSDGADFLQDVTEELAHRARKKPELRTKYARVFKVAEQRSQAISEGIARARSKKGSEPKEG